MEIKKQAEKYFNLGIPVIPVRIREEDDGFEKKPLIQWSKFVDSKQTREEFEAIDWSQADGFGIVCGHETPYGFIFAIDIDLDCDQALKKLREWPQFKITRLERTVRNRLHLLYFSKLPVPSIRRDGVPVELIGRGKLCIMAPSKGYDSLNDNSPAIIQDGYEYYLELCKAFGYELDEQVKNEQKDTFEAWLNKILDSSKLEVKGHGPNYIYAKCPFHPPDRNPSFAIHSKKFYAVDYHTGEVFTLKELAEKLGINLHERENNGGGGEKKRSVKILSLVLPEKAIVFESIGKTNGLGDFDPCLLVYGSAGFQICDTYILDNNIIEARHPKSYPYKPYMVSELSAKTRLELIDLVFREINTFIDAELQEKAVFTAFVVLSYLQELFDTLPYLYVVGDNESGKTHLIILLGELCYRPLVGVSHTAADLYSYLEDDTPLTIIEDEFQGSERDSEKMKIYKSGYKKGAKVARVTTFDGGRRIDYFNCFGLKIMAAEKLVENKGLLQRCIVIEMVEGYPQKDYYDVEDYERFSWLRSELLKWRMRVLAKHEELPTLNIDWLRGRDRELYLPLLTILHGSKLYDVLHDFLKRKVEEKILERSSSLEAMVVKNILEILQNSKEVDFTDLWGRLLHDLDGEEIKPPHLTSARAMHSEVYGEVSKKDIANILKNKLGMIKMKTKRDGRNIILYIPNMEKLKKAYRKYLNTSISSQTPNSPNCSETPIPENLLKTLQRNEILSFNEG